MGTLTFLFKLCLAASCLIGCLLVLGWLFFKATTSFQKKCEHPLLSGGLITLQDAIVQLSHYSINDVFYVEKIYNILSLMREIYREGFDTTEEQTAFENCQKELQEILCIIPFCYSYVIQRKVDKKYLTINLTWTNAESAALRFSISKIANGFSAYFMEPYTFTIIQFKES